MCMTSYLENPKRWCVKKLRVNSSPENRKRYVKYTIPKTLRFFISVEYPRKEQCRYIDLLQFIALIQYQFSYYGRSFERFGWRIDALFHCVLFVLQRPATFSLTVVWNVHQGSKQISGKFLTVKMCLKWFIVIIIMIITNVLDKHRVYVILLCAGGACSVLVMAVKLKSATGLRRSPGPWTTEFMSLTYGKAESIHSKNSPSSTHKWSGLYLDQGFH